MLFYIIFTYIFKNALCHIFIFMHVIHVIKLANGNVPSQIFLCDNQFLFFYSILRNLTQIANENFYSQIANGNNNFLDKIFFFFFFFDKI